MAKASPKAPDQGGEISLTVFKFSMSGSDASLQKGLDNIKAAFAQAGLIPAMDAPRQVRSNGSVKHLTASTASNNAEAAAADDGLDSDVLDAEEVEEVPMPTAPRKPPTSRRPPKLMTELTFEDVATTFPAFCVEKDPQTDYDKYKCIAYWFKHHKATPDLTVRHFFTAYTFMNWRPPTNASQPISDLRKKNAFSAGEKHGTSTINMVGEKQVRELRKAND